MEYDTNIIRNLVMTGILCLSVALFLFAMSWRFAYRRDQESAFCAMSLSWIVSIFATIALCPYSSIDKAIRMTVTAYIIFMLLVRLVAKRKIQDCV